MAPKVKRAPSAPRPPAVSAAGQAVGGLIAGQKPPGATANPGRPAGVTGVNQNAGSKQYGQTYVVQPATGGVYHVYGNGQKIFVPTSTAPASGSAASTATAAPPDPRDAQYYADTAQDTFDRNAKINDITTTGQRDKTDTAEAIRRLLATQPQALQNARESANKQGLFNSGQLGKREGDINTQYAQQQGDVQRDADRRESDRQTAVAAIQGGASLAEVQRLLEATDRQTGRDTTAADAGALTTDTPAPAATGQRTNPKTGLSYTTVTIAGKKYHLYLDGRKVRVGK
jgi:hypothetical protein